MIMSEKQLLANCLDALQEASESLDDIRGVDSDIMQWHEQIQSLYSEVLARYES